MMQAKGRLIGLGVGPGDPELITVKALRLLRESPVVAYFVAKGKGQRLRHHRSAPAGRAKPAAAGVPGDHRSFAGTAFL